MNRVIIILLMSISIFWLTGCSEKQEINREILFYNTGDVFGVTKIQGQQLTEIEVLYNVSLTDFYPEESAFDTYNSMYTLTDPDKLNTREISITENTRIYQLIEGNKVKMDFEQFYEDGRGHKIEFWVFPYNYVIEAMEIVILD